MNPKRKQRLYLTAFLFLIAGGVTTLLIQISGENMNMFYPPEDVVSGKAPVGERLRAGGMVRSAAVAPAAGTVGSRATAASTLPIRSPALLSARASAGTR